MKYMETEMHYLFPQGKPSVGRCSLFHQVRHLRFQI